MKRVEMPEVKWIAENEAWLEKEHPGKWIAVKGQSLVAVGDSLHDVLQEATRRGITDPLVTAMKRLDVQGTIIIR